MKTEKRLKIVEEIKSQGLSFDDGELFTKDIALVQKGLLQVLRKSRIFGKFVKYVKRGILSFNLKEFAGRNHQDFLHALQALKELGVLDMEINGDQIGINILNVKFFGKKTWRRAVKVLFAGATAYRTMKKLKKTFKVAFNIARENEKLYDVGILTDEKCLFFIVGVPEKKIDLSVPYEVYSLVSPASIRHVRHFPRALNVLKLRSIIEKHFS